VYSTLCNAHVKMHPGDGSHGVAGRASRLGRYLDGENEPRVLGAFASKRMQRIAATMKTVASTVGSNSPHHGSLTRRDAVIKRTLASILRESPSLVWLSRISGDVFSSASVGLRNAGGEGRDVRMSALD